jgi:hypothetical protein
MMDKKKCMDNTHYRPRDKLTRIVCIVIGSIAVIIGVIGIVVPLLPTTPFLLLAAVCYGRSSRRLYRWLITNKWCGTYIRRYREGEGVSVKIKALTITLLWLTILFSFFCVVSSTLVRILLLVIAGGVTLHILLLRTYKKTEYEPTDIGTLSEDCSPEN